MITFSNFRDIILIKITDFFYRSHLEFIVRDITIENLWVTNIWKIDFCFNLHDLKLNEITKKFVYGILLNQYFLIVHVFRVRNLA